MAKNLDYDSAFEQLKDIVEKMQEEDIEIEKLSTYLKKASELKSFCYNRLREIEKEIETFVDKQS